MAKEYFKPGNMLYPVPAVMVSCQLGEERPNIITVAWAGTVCTQPAMLSISVRPERYSYHQIEESGEFVVNLVTKDLVHAADYCGVKSGRDVDKFKETGLTLLPSKHIAAPGIAESPVCIECVVKQKLELGSHHMFLAEVVNVTVDDAYMDENRRFRLNASNLVAYSHGEYRVLGELLGTFGYSVQKPKTKKKKSHVKNKGEK